MTDSRLSVPEQQEPIKALIVVLLALLIIASIQAWIWKLTLAQFLLTLICYLNVGLIRTLKPNSRSKLRLPALIAVNFFVCALFGLAYSAVSGSGLSAIAAILVFGIAGTTLMLVPPAYQFFAMLIFILTFSGMLAMGLIK